MRDTTDSTALPGYEQALDTVLARVSELDEEWVPLGGALNRVLCEAVIADRDQPPFDRSAMDGYAVRCHELVIDKPHPIVATIPAGSVADPSADLARGVSRIATGAVVPPVYDAVVPVERAREDAQGQHVVFEKHTIDPGACIHRRGADAKAGQVLIEPGTLLNAPHIGIAAAVGAVMLSVKHKPSVSLITTGDEVRPPATATNALEPYQIRNSNGPMLDALLRGLGTELMDHVHVTDDPEATRAAAEEALSKSDLVITVGGVSAGRRDYLPGVWEELGLETIIKGVAIQPGKPVLVAQPASDRGKLVIGLPGNPVSVFATAHLFVWPVVRAMLGLSAGLPWRRVWTTDEIKTNPRREAFRPARLTGGTLDQAQVIRWQGSGDLAHTAGTDGFLRLPAQAQPLSAGAEAWFLPMIGGAL